MIKYTKAFTAMHWLHAVVIALLLIGASLNLPDLPKIGTELAPFKQHIILGLAALVLTIIRLIMLRAQPSFPALDMSDFRASIMKWNHRLIYIFLFVVAISGIATASSANIGDIVLFGKDASIYSPNNITDIAGEVHEISTTILMILIAMHIFGVVSYIFKTKDNIMKRMSF